ncbi:MAG: FIST N-terminal domain-containing protein [Fibrobacteria bacterium]
MTEISYAYSNLADSMAVGEALSKELLEGMKGEAPHVVILFASSRFDSEVLLESIQGLCRPAMIVGCTSAGEFTSGGFGPGAASALAIRSTNIRFSVRLARDIDADRLASIEKLAASLEGLKDFTFPFRSLLVLTDALAGQSEESMGLLNQASGGIYQIFGGGAGDDGRFESTKVFAGTKAYSRSMVVLEILSKKPLGIGIVHGWQPGSEPMRVTKSDGMRLIGLNAAPAFEAFEEYAKTTAQELDKADPFPFFLHNIIGIETPDGMKLRVPLKVEADGSILCAAEIPEGASVRIMSTSVASTTSAAMEASRTALKGLEGAKPKAVLFFDCVATRLRMGKDFGGELEAMSGVLGRVPYVGCNTYGQIAKVDGQFNGFHNCTAVVCALPE